LKISHRLQKIDSFIVNHYEHIWDCCCDHGFLGLHLLERQAADTLHFIDTVEHILLNLKSQLEQRRDIPQSRWQTHCLDAAKLDLYPTGRPSNKPQLIIIAGVGGELTISLVTDLLKSHPDLNLEFLLCPVHHNYKVRQALIELELGLIDECLLQENKRFYEVIHVSRQAKKTISKVGSIMWDLSRAMDSAYLNATIGHYQRMGKKNGEVKDIIEDYQALLG